MADAREGEKRLREAAHKLAVALELCEKAINGAFQMAAVHGFDYTEGGKYSYGKELDEVKRALQNLPPATPQPGPAQDESTSRLRELCAAVYQFVGANMHKIGGCRRFLDALSNAANGQPFDVDALLPYDSEEPVCFTDVQPAQPETRPASAEPQIKQMVERFLQWKLPENFNPDCGISFKKMFNENTPHPMKHEPVGTNLFDADQVEAMIRYILELPAKEDAAVTLQDKIETVLARENVFHGQVGESQIVSLAERIVELVKADAK